MHYFSSHKRVHEQRKLISSRKIEWKYERQALELVAKFKNVEQSMSEEEIIRNIIEMLPIGMQSNLAATDYREMDCLLAYLRKMDTLKERNDLRINSEKKNTLKDRDRRWRASSYKSVIFGEILNMGILVELNVLGIYVMRLNMKLVDKDL